MEEVDTGSGEGSVALVIAQQLIYKHYLVVSEGEGHVHVVHVYRVHSL